MKKKIRVMLVSIGYSPNVGGIETHFDDLTKKISSEVDFKVLTYMPLTSSVKAKMFEVKGGLEIFRIPIVKGLFYKLVDKPIFEFIYLAPLLAIFMPILLLTKYRNINLIHSHGLVAGLVSVFWGKVFDIKVITTTHSVYSFGKRGLFSLVSKYTFKLSDLVLCLSQQSVEEVVALEVNRNKVLKFTYWVDSKIFKPLQESRKILSDKLRVLFVGRLVSEKGIPELLSSMASWPKDVELIIAGSGPLSEMIEAKSKIDKRIKFLGRVGQLDLPSVYSSSDLLIVPSVHEEGFGRVVIESLMCGTPVLASNRGGLVEAIDSSVGDLITITPKKISERINFYKRNKNYLKSKSNHAREYALKRFSESNSSIILNSYQSLL